MSIDPLFRRSGRIGDFTGFSQQSPENTDPPTDSPQAAAPSNLQNQNPEAANARRSEAGITANQLQSQLLNQTNKTISTGTNRIPNHQSPKNDGAALQKALRMYGITNEQLQRYISTGEEPEGLKKAINDARTKGEWPALNIVRASFQKRANYLRANSGPADKESRLKADQLDAESASLLRNREAIQLKRAGDSLESGRRYSTPPDKIQRKIEQASKAIENVSSEIETQIKPRK